MLLIWHEALGSDDEQATDDELCARVLYSYDDCSDDSKVLSSLRLVQGLLAFVRAFRQCGDRELTKGTASTEWTPEWASVTLSRRRFFILEVEQQVFMALVRRKNRYFSRDHSFLTCSVAIAIAAGCPAHS